MNQDFPKQSIHHISMGDKNEVEIKQTFNKIEIIQISVDEIKTRKFIKTSPYKGLKKFESTDKELFFGRDQFLKYLTTELESTNFILLLGASGSGKSSLVRAGLIPSLQRDKNTLVNLTFRPDKDHPNLPFPLDSWSLLCLYGSFYNHAKDVMFACEKVVALAPKNEGIIAWRGMARALTGDYEGSISDFETAVKVIDDSKDKLQIQGWINKLRNGKNPFTQEVLEDLRKELEKELEKKSIEQMEQL